MIGARDRTLSEVVDLPTGTERVRIVELEAETTFLREVSTANYRAEHLRLDPGSAVKFTVGPDERRLVVKGSYESRHLAYSRRAAPDRHLGVQHELLMLNASKAINVGNVVSSTTVPWP